jgi:hypothetical protein
MGEILTEYMADGLTLTSTLAEEYFSIIQKRKTVANFVHRSADPWRRTGTLDNFHLCCYAAATSIFVLSSGVLEQTYGEIRSGITKRLLVLTNR